MNAAVQAALWAAQRTQYLAYPRPGAAWAFTGPWAMAPGGVPSRNAVRLPTALLTDPLYGPANGPLLNSAGLGAEVVKAMYALVQLPGLLYDKDGLMDPVLNFDSWENLFYLNRDTFGVCADRVCLPWAPRVPLWGPPVRAWALEDVKTPPKKCIPPRMLYPPKKFIAPQILYPPQA